MSKKIPLLLFSIVIASGINAQSKAKSEKLFVKELNAILKSSPTIHWAYEDKMSIDSVFAIKNGILSVTVRYTTDSSFFRVRMAAPVSKIKSVAEDIYMILQFSANDVAVYISQNNSNELVFDSHRNLFHLGSKEDEGKTQIKLQLLLEKLLTYY